MEISIFQKVNFRCDGDKKELEKLLSEELCGDQCVPAMWFYEPIGCQERIGRYEVKIFLNEQSSPRKYTIPIYYE